MIYSRLEVNIDADPLVAALLSGSPERRLAILDSSGVGHLGSHLLIAGIDPVETIEVFDDPEKALDALDNAANSRELAAIFTVSYDLGRIGSRKGAVGPRAADEPLVSISLFDTLIIHDYDNVKTEIRGSKRRIDEMEATLAASQPMFPFGDFVEAGYRSNLTQTQYVKAVETVKEYIRAGDTYQANLTQRLCVDIHDRISPESVFLRLRAEHPAPFGAFIRRGDSTVVSASPERFLKIAGRNITASPIKGTRRRGANAVEDLALRNELLASSKDRAENTMIVDLLRNDLGRVCEFGSVKVERMCEVEEHPTLFHLVSTISGTLRDNVTLREIMSATFPCGSITGAPKIRTMEIIDEIEDQPRGLSMGAIGYSLPPAFGLSPESVVDMSVAIRTMVIRNGEAVFNVGGGIVIDSDPIQEYSESLLKAKALLHALGCSEPN